MHVATILPQEYLPLAVEDNYHMALAHLIGKTGFEKYTKFFTDRPRKHYLIMDNGVIEGDPRPIEELVRKAKQIGADEIILPDCFMDKDKTLDMTCEALQYVKEYAPDLNVMAVPQGKTIREWLECAQIMLTFDIDALGIPKVLTKIANSSRARLEVLELLGHSVRGLDIHLLGCWENPIELQEIQAYVDAGKILPVRGVDSAIAYAYARNGMRIQDGPRPEGAINFAANDADMEVLKQNIDHWKKACSGFMNEGNVTYL